MKARLLLALATSTLLWACGADETPSKGPFADAAQSAGQDVATPDTVPEADVTEDAGDAGCDGCAPVCEGCLEGGECIATGAPIPGQACRICGADGPMSAEEGTDCEAKDACSAEGRCEGGTCIGKGALSCDDDEACTSDSCDPATGCAHTPTSGSCDDGDACTSGDACKSGVCEGGASVVCDDGDDCTADACDPLAGCTTTPETGTPCDDGDACTENDACAAGTCMPTVEIPCDDDDPCTADACNPFSGCVHLPTDAACDDGDPCTTDACEGGACTHEDAAADTACEDGDACTLGDVCTGGACQAGAEQLPCDDGNACTDDSCLPATGCAHVPGAGGPCDDGLACTFDDVCSANGKCKGTPVDCGPCEPEFATTVVVATSLLIAPDGKPGNGLDVDQDPATCAPAGSCSGGIDNAAAALGSLMNDGLNGAIEKGLVAYLLELDGVAPGATFELNLYAGEPETAGCNPAQSACTYLVWPTMLDTDTCEALTSFTNASLTGTTLKAGGPTYSFPLSLPIIGGANLDVIIEAVQLQGTLTLGPTGLPSSFDGVLAGAVRKDVLIAAIYQIPPEALILPPEQLVGLLDTMLTMDIDTDGDGAVDAYSVGFLAKAKPATIVGATEP